MPKSRKSYIANMGRILMRRFTLKKARSNPKLSLMNHSPGSRSPAVSRGTYHRKKASIRAPVKYRPFITTVKSPTSRRRSTLREGMNTNMFKNLVVQQRNRTKSMKTPLGSRF